MSSTYRKTLIESIPLNVYSAVSSILLINHNLSSVMNCFISCFYPSSKKLNLVSSTQKDFLQSNTLTLTERPTKLNFCQNTTSTVLCSGRGVCIATVKYVRIDISEVNQSLLWVDCDVLRWVVALLFISCTDLHVCDISSKQVIYTGRLLLALSDFVHEGGMQTSETDLKTKWTKDLKVVFDELQFAIKSLHYALTRCRC